MPLVVTAISSWRASNCAVGFIKNFLGLFEERLHFLDQILLISVLFLLGFEMLNVL